jgi:hypothetical protein
MRYGQFYCTATDRYSPARRHFFTSRFNREVEKNLFPVKCQCKFCGHKFECGTIDQLLQRSNVCYGCDLKNKVEIAAETLFHLISAIPQAERDAQEIYPGDFRKAQITPEHDWRFPYGLRDYSEPTKLLNKFGQYEFAIRQKGDTVWPGCDMVGPAEWSPVYNIRLGLLKTPDQQRTLKRIGRYYKNSCWYPQIKKQRRLFDRCESLSWQKLLVWKPGQVSISLENPDTVKLAELMRVAKSGGSVQILGSPAKRHANLVRTRDAYNEQWPSYWNIGRTKRSGWDFGIREPKTGIAGIGEILREQGSLNIPHQTIEVRNHMVTNLARDFGRADEAERAA